MDKQKRILKETKVNKFENGHTIWLKGEKYRLYFRSAEKNIVFRTNDQIIVFTKNIEDSEYSEQVLKNWLKEVARQEFITALEKYRNRMRKKYDVPNYVLQIRSMKTRWGTCIPSKKKITLNLNLIFAPREYIECIALHELTHFLEIRHDAHFYGIMQEFMPNYKEIQEKLNKEYSRIVRG